MGREQKSIGTREKMLEVAERLFAERGYDGAHLERIARDVGVRKTALYYYFDNKQALYLAVLERILETVLDTFVPIWQRDLPVRERVLQTLDSATDMLASRPNYARIVIRIFIDRSPVDTSSIQPLMAKLVSSALAIYEEAADAGLLRELSARHLFQSGLGMQLFHWAGGEVSALVLGVPDIHHPEAVAERREQVREVLFRGILAPGD